VDVRRDRLAIGGGAHVRAASLTLACAVLRGAAVDPEPLLWWAGIDPESLEDADNVVPFRSASRLLARAAAVTAREDLGLELGRRFDLDTLGIAGLVARHSPTVGAALNNLLRYMPLHGRGGVPLLAVDGRFVSLGYALQEPGVEAADQVQDLAIAAAVNVLRGLCGSEWRPCEIRLAHRAPADAAPWRRHFGCAPRFDACDSAVAFAAAWLDRPVPGANPARLLELERLAADLELADGRTTTQRARAAVRTALAHRSCTAERVCHVLGVSYRTLNRRLAAEGTTFQAIVDSVRTDVATRLLAQTDMPLTEIADALDFSDLSAFSRAFSRWTGHPPSRARRAAALEARSRETAGHAAPCA
jgi:AraC-like DNA-binding protein